MQTILVGLASHPQVALAILVVAELSFLAYILITEIKFRHLRSVLLMIPRLVQTFFLVSLETYLLISYMMLKDKRMALPEGVQRRIIQIILISNYSEYAIILLEIFLILKSLIITCKAKKNPKFAEFWDKHFGIIAYKPFKDQNIQVNQAITLTPALLHPQKPTKFRRRISQELFDEMGHKNSDIFDPALGQKQANLLSKQKVDGPIPQKIDSFKKFKRRVEEFSGYSG